MSQNTYTTNGLSKASMFETTIQPAQAWLIIISNEPHPMYVVSAPQWDVYAVLI